jgi:hypothetical protein
MADDSQVIRRTLLMNRRARRSGTIEITLAGGSRVCVCGEVSPETLRQVIELLR